MSQSMSQFLRRLDTLSDSDKVTVLLFMQAESSKRMNCAQQDAVLEATNEHMDIIEAYLEKTA